LIEVAIWVGFAFGGLLCLMNVSLPVRHYYRRWKKLPEERYVSPIPLLGSLFVFLTLRVLDVIPIVKVIGWILIAIDVGGLHWMVFSLAFHTVRALVKRPEEHNNDTRVCSQ
jgi:amino acid transporter